LGEVCAALAGFDLDVSLLEDGLPGLLRRVPLERKRWLADELRLALDEPEYDAAVFDFVPRPSGMAYMGAISEWFAKAARMERERWGQARFGPYDGIIRDGDLLESLHSMYGRPGTVVSPSRLEEYAGCPFDFFLKHVLGVREAEAPSDELELPPLERGAMMHELLMRLYSLHLRGRRLGDVGDAEVKLLVGRAAAVLDELGRIRAASRPATWQVERERMLRQVRAVLVHERQVHPNAAPARFEHVFDETDPGYRLRCGPDVEVVLTGRADRVDDMAGGGIQVADYKTGKSSRFRKNSLAGGTQLQLPIYLLAAAEQMGAPEGAALYLSTEDAKDIPEFTLTELRARIEDLRGAVRLILEGIRAGEFFPLPADRRRCELHCPYRHVCGTARSALARMKHGDPRTARLGALRALE
jgi:RecB family exonuclease